MQGVATMIPLQGNLAWLFIMDTVSAAIVHARFIKMACPE
jgi:hypothetical protein